jgi:hypothetical protein
MSLTVVPLTNSILTEQVDALVKDTPSSWFWHRPKWRDYEMARNPRLVDYSWAVMDDDVPVASQLLTYNPDLQLFGLGDLAAPFTVHMSKRKFSEINAIMDTTFKAVVSCVPAYVRFRSMPTHRHFCTGLTSPLDDVMGRSHIWLNESCKTRVIDLSVDDLWSSIRKSYRHIITDSSSKVVVSEEHSDQTWELCQQMHTHASGRETRPSESWRHQERFVDAGDASWFIAREYGTDQLLGFTYVIHWKAWAYYASAATLRPNVSHPLQWAIIKRLKERGVRYYEIGQQGQDGSKKGKGIEFFRRGFGGTDVVQSIYSTDLSMVDNLQGSVH